MRKWLKITLIVSVVLVIIFIIGLLLAILIGQQAQPDSVSRAILCGNEKSNCYQTCEQKLIDYFCKNNCDQSYQQCMNNY